MGIGAGIFLVALGAILTFAVDWHVHGLNIHAVGWVLMLAGVAGIILYFVFWTNRRRPAAVVTTRRSGYPDQVAPIQEPVAYQESSVTYRDPNMPPPPGV